MNGRYRAPEADDRWRAAADLAGRISGLRPDPCAEVEANLADMAADQPTLDQARNTTPGFSGPARVFVRAVDDPHAEWAEIGHTVIRSVIVYTVGNLPDVGNIQPDPTTPPLP